MIEHEFFWRKEYFIGGNGKTATYKQVKPNYMNLYLGPAQVLMRPGHALSTKNFRHR